MKQFSIGCLERVASPLEGEAGLPQANREGGMNSAHRPVSGLQRGRAKSLRREMTDAERKLWMALRGHRFQGLSFRRQAPIGPFIADFVCHRRRLIIEIDGGQHATRPAHDLRRDTWLASKGYRVLRFWNSDVLRNIEGVLETIVNAIAGDIPPSLTLPLKGGGDRWTQAPRDVSHAIVVDHAPLPDPSPQGRKGQASTRGEAEA